MRMMEFQIDTVRDFTDHDNAYTSDYEAYTILKYMMVRFQMYSS